MSLRPDASERPKLAARRGPEGQLSNRRHRAAGALVGLQGENILWKQTLPEAGQSGIAIVGDKLFLTVKKPLPEGAPNETHSTADSLGLCLDARTGKILWQIPVPGTKSQTYISMFISEPTPVADEKRVWFITSNGGIVCADHNGKELWKRAFDVDPLHNAQFCQPMLVDGKLVHVALKEPLTEKLSLGKSSGNGPWNCLHACDAATGKPLWKPAPALPPPPRFHTLNMTSTQT